MRQLKITKQITQRNDDTINRYFNEINKYPLVTAEEEEELSVRIRAGDNEALNKLVQANLRFVISVAKQYQNQGLSFSDLINEGNIGLVKAAKRFDETRGFKFISYAVWWIRQAILQAISEQSRMVRLPLNKIGEISKIKKASSSLEQHYQRPPNALEIASELDMNSKQVKLAMKNSGKHVSMDAPFETGESSNLYNVIESKDATSPDANLMRDSLNTDMNQALKSLPDRESEVIRLYYGLGERTPKSLSEIGELFDLTRERVRQIREKAIRKLRRKSQNKMLQSYL